MATRNSLNEVKSPTGPYLPSSQAGGFVSGAELMRPKTGVWPAANADGVTSPLKYNRAITNVAPSFTGMTFIPWNSGKFNKQSQRWMAVPNGKGPANGRCVGNVATDRGNDYASTGMPFPCWLHTWFYTDAPRIIVEYYVWNNHAAANGVATPNHDVRLFAERESGRIDRISESTKTWTHAQGGGNQTFYDEYEFSRGDHRQMELMMSAGCWFAGIWVSTGARVSMAPNYPVLLVDDGDSWQEPIGNVWSSVGGNGGIAGNGWANANLLDSNTAVQTAIATGLPVINLGHGGTGYDNAGAGTSAAGNEDLVGYVGFGPFLSTSRINHWSATYGPDAAVNRYSTYLNCGAYNDGSGATQAARRAKALKGFQKLYAKDPTMPVLIQGVQVKSIVTGNGYDLANNGIKLAVQDMKDLYGAPFYFLDDIADYKQADGSIPDMIGLGDDGLHPKVQLGQFVGKNRYRALCPVKFPRARILLTQNAIVP